MKITLDQLVQNLSDSGLMTADEASSCCESLATLAGPTESATVVQELAATGKLTAYQAECVCQGETTGLVFDEYLVLDKIGQGGMGVVLKARHRRMNRIVAVKKLPTAALESEAAVKRFYREVEASARLMHPNVVAALDAREHEGVHYLVMEYVEGQDLAKVVNQRGPLPVDEAVDYIVQAARGLQFAHTHGVFHRDVKPANLLLDQEGVVKILDMGLARIVSEAKAGDAGGDSLTTDGQVMGTGDYMAPEQAEQTRTVDHRVDIYSLGCTLYRLLTDDPPYPGTNLMQILYAHREAEIPSMCEKRPDVPAAVDAVFQKMVAKTPEERYASMAEVIEALQAALGRGPAESVAPEPDRELTDFLQRTRRESSVITGGGRRSGKTAAGQGTATIKQKTAPASDETIDHVAQADTHPSQVTQRLSATTTAAPRPRRSAARRKQTRMLLLIGVGVGLSLIGAAVIAAIVYVQTNYGTVVVQTKDKDVEVLVKQGGDVVDIIDAKGKWRVRVKSGEYRVELKGGNDKFALDKDTITVTRRGEVLVHVARKSSQFAWHPGSPTPAIAPFNSDQAKQHQQAWAEYLGVPIEYTNSIGMKFHLIPPGEFLMGSPEAEQQSALEDAKVANARVGIFRIPEEGPQHQVRITKPFYLGVYEVTQDEYERVTGTNPSVFSPAGKNGDRVPGMDTSRFPVEMVSWERAAEFCPWLSAMPAEKSAGRVYRLPTEAEWEYACRAGTTTPFHFGDQLNGREANCKGENPNGTETKDPYLERTTTVGSYQPNAFGLYDMHGNANEWCQDRYSGAYYNFSPSEDPAGPATGSGRLIRGGCWIDIAGLCRSARRVASSPGFRHNDLGFRVACDIPYTPDGKIITPGAASPPPPDKWKLPSDAPPPAVAPFDAGQAEQHQQAWAEHLGVPIEQTNSIGMKFRLIPPGEFLMGSPEAEQQSALEEAKGDKGWVIERIPTEGPRHQVRITKPFYLGVYEVTQGDYERVTGTNPSKFSPAGIHRNAVQGMDTSRFPVEMVSWGDSAEFCPWLSALPAEKSAGRVYRLPTEAEWECACRAGTTTPFHFGSQLNGREANCDGENPYGTETKGPNLGRPTTVGSYPPNAFGLYDMHGNVWEACQDWHADAYYNYSPSEDPAGPATGSHHVFRGGGWYGFAGRCRSASRIDNSPGNRLGWRGFRVVLVPADASGT